MYHLIGLGSNWKAEQQMEKMLSAFSLIKGSCRISQVQKTPACGDIKAPKYLNAVVLIETDMSCAAIHKWCKQQEKMLGRNQLAAYGECEADFDLLLSWQAYEAMPALATIEESYYLPLAEKLLTKHMPASSFKRLCI